LLFFLSIQKIRTVRLPPFFPSFRGSHYTRMSSSVPPESRGLGKKHRAFFFFLLFSSETITAHASNGLLLLIRPRAGFLSPSLPTHRAQDCVSRNPPILLDSSPSFFLPAAIKKIHRLSFPLPSPFFLDAATTETELGARFWSRPASLLLSPPSQLSGIPRLYLSLLSFFFTALGAENLCRT